ncbi:MAG: YceI family protein [Candidatus Omnitrophica bacterium]|nr:YceI family protein [Candidatus Omnitrophota bacterium]
MKTYNQTTAACYIYTFKKGLLSALAHDLKIQVFKFEIKTTGSTKDTADWKNIEARFDAASLRTVCAMKDGARSPAKLSDQDKRDIDRNIINAVLHSQEFPGITFRSSSITRRKSGVVIKGALTICGQTRTITLPVQELNTCYRSELVIDQRDFGIQPFSALMGAMQIKPEIIVRIELGKVTAKAPLSEHCPTDP